VLAARIGAIVQMDGRFFPGDAASAATETFELRRARLVVSATAFGRFESLFVPDFGQGVASIKDAWLLVRIAPALALRAGKQKTPFGLERLQPETDTVFAESALPTALAPNRDVGISLQGEVPALAYAVGVFNGVADGGSGDTDTNGGKDVVARVFAHPFRARRGSPLAGLGIGAAVTAGEEAGSAALPSYKTSGLTTFFAYSAGAAASGRRTRIAPQASWVVGPLRALAEWTRVSQEVARQAAEARVVTDAWAVTAGYTVHHGSWGALEVAARVHRLTVGSAAFESGLADGNVSARRATAWALGLSCYLGGYVRVSADFERTSFQGGRARGDRSPEHEVVFRTQLAF
jgi:phosphate-selective porin OprO/OprP